MRDSAQDELIFDYLEGNLSPEEKAAFELLKDDSEVLDREVRLWQNAYVDEPLVDVAALEEKLFIKPDSGSWTFRNSLYVLAIFAVIHLLVPGDSGADKNESSTRQSMVVINEQSPLEIACAVVPEVVHHLKPVVARKVVIYITQTQNENNSTETQTTSLPTDQLLDKQSLVVNASVDDIKIVDALSAPDILDKEFRIITKTKTSTIVGKKWSRKQKRAIHKKLWRDLENRDAGTFLKGDVPYVVPLNSNNF